MRGTWTGVHVVMRNVEQILDKVAIGQMAVGATEMGKLSSFLKYVGEMLRDCVWRAMKGSWVVPTEQNIKRCVGNELMKN